ncbi:MAG: porin [Gammaproteobacteria bacterium]|nr:porin [Gammaproteobacteria bacterium]
MKQKLSKFGLLLSIIALFLPAAAQAENTVYGKLQVALEHIDDETDASDYWDVVSHDSRFGVKGSMDTDTESLKVIYQMEWAIDVTDEANSSDDHIKARNQFVGLEGEFGQVIVGRNDTPFKASQGKLDLFNDYFDMKLLMAGGENRESNIIQYASPEIADAVTVTIMAQPGEDPTSEDENGVADATSASIAYDSDSLYVALALDDGMDGQDVKGTRLSATWKIGDFGLGAMLQSTDWNTTDDEEVALISAYYKIDKLKLKAQFGHTDNYRGIATNFAGDENTADYSAIGFDYSLSKKTTLGAYLGNLEGGDNLFVDPLIGGPYSKDVLGIILIHSF